MATLDLWFIVFLGQHMSNRTAIILGVLAVAAATAAVAGEAVYGYGDTRAQAASSANQNATELAYKRFPGRSNCITPVRPQDCKQDSGGWVCVAYIANHEGSCG